MEYKDNFTSRNSVTICTLDATVTLNLYKGLTVHCFVKGPKNKEPVDCQQRAASA